MHHLPGMKVPRHLLLAFLMQEGELRPRRTAVLALVASVASAAALMSANAAVEQLEKGAQHEINFTLPTIFTLAILAQYLAERGLIASIAQAMERAIHRVRSRLVKRVCEADFVHVERMGQDQLHESIVQATGVLSQNSQSIAFALTSAVTTTLMLAYILSLSVMAFVILLIGGAVGSFIYYRLGAQVAAKFAENMNHERSSYNAMKDLLDGFREARMWDRRAAAMRSRFARLCEVSTAARISLHAGLFSQIIFGQVAFYFLLGLIVFIVPTYAPDFSTDILKISAAVIFIIGPLGTTIQSLSVLAAGKASAQRMWELDAKLEKIRDPAFVNESAPLPKDFEKIALTSVSFSYPPIGEEAPFGVRNIDFQVSRGEVVFVTGGNGSGKTTFLKLLTALYAPSTGQLMVDTNGVGDANRSSYRELFSVVFTSQHLPQRIHGIDTPQPEEVRKLLEWMEISNIVSIEGKRISTTRLSSGQRKRVQLVAALLEHRPILVLDEWAADQDPAFRAKFYTEIIPALKRQGLTIIAVTHDDHYFFSADRCVSFEGGEISSSFEQSPG